MKKILYIVPTFSNGGIENSVKDLCNNLSKDNEIVLLCLCCNEIELKEQLSDKVKFISLDILNSKKGLINILRLFSQLFVMSRMIRKIGPDVIHTHVFFYHIIPVLISMKLSGVRFKHVHTIHTSGMHYTNNNYVSNIKSYIERKSYNYFDTNIVCISPMIKNIIKVKFPERLNYSYNIANGVDDAKFDLCGIRDKEECNICRFVYVARLVEGKNHITLLKAFKKLLEEKDNLELVLLGDGNLYPVLNDYVINNNLQSKVIFKGNVANVAYELSKCDVGVFPSEYEGFSLAIIEMMAMGLPIICSNIDAFISIFEKDEVLFFDCFDEKQLVKSMSILMNDLDKRKYYSAKSRFIAQRYSISKIVEKYNNMYGKL